MANSSKKIKEIGEDLLIKRITKDLPLGKDVVTGAGDDCAVITGNDHRSYVLLKIDCVIEGIHYMKSTPPSAVGYKALSRAISDIAAMGGTPKHAMISLSLRPECNVSYVTSLYRGLSKASSPYNISIVGGETASCGKNGTPSVTVSLTGQVRKDRCCFRSKGKSGHILFVTGKLGKSLNGHHLRFTPRIREAQWLTKKFKPSAMMDLSDGLASDLPRLAKSSNCGYSIEKDKIPKARGASIKEALCDGEDYELLFAIPSKDCKKLEVAWQKKFPSLTLTRIGKLSPKGTENPDLKGGWKHF
ncbi:thiamine-phosphate kinase [Verrucomicrobia bacterium]|nr:thiamine-phosphate kinase [Verrucomicrobiota bacterium]